MIDADRLQSAIFYGPPGTGKTSLAEVIAGRLSAAFEQMNAAMVGVKEVRECLERASDRLLTTKQRTVLFLDEVHRFNRAQQDVLLPDVEDGVVILIGATTENPFFALNAPLVSRSQIFRFEPLSEAEIWTCCGARWPTRSEAWAGTRSRWPPMPWPTGPRRAMAMPAEP